MNDRAQRLNRLRSNFAGASAMLDSLNKEMTGLVAELPDTKELRDFKKLPDEVSARMEKAVQNGKAEEMGMKIMGELKDIQKNAMNG